MDAITSLNSIEPEEKASKKEQGALLSVEFFHIYTNETIGSRHIKSLSLLKKIKKNWSLAHKSIVLIDNYNSTKHMLTAEEILNYLDTQNVLPEYWAYEKDLVPFADKFLAKLINPKLKRSYESYIRKNKKYPCSLLTASWYLLRLGRFENEGIVKTTLKTHKTYEAADKLLNILPDEYQNVEKRARELIYKSEFTIDADKIQDLFYLSHSGSDLDLF
jgi:hypothetical protein